MKLGRSMSDIQKGYFITLDPDQASFHKNIEIFVALRIHKFTPQGGIPKNLEAKRAYYRKWSEIVLDKFNLSINFQPCIDRDPALYLGSKGIGCQISHCLVWEKIAKEPDGYYLISEEKGYQEDIKYVLDNYILPGSLEEGQKARHHAFGSKSNLSLLSAGGVNAAVINLNTRGCNGTESYLITPAACRKLLTFFQGGWDWIAEVDHFLFRGGHRIVPGLVDANFMIGLDLGWVRYIEKGVARNFLQSQPPKLKTSRRQPPLPHLTLH